MSVESRDDQIYHRLTYSTSIEINAESVDSAYKSLRPFVLPVYIEEDDIPGISISESELTLFENRGVGKSDAVYSVVLDTMPLVLEKYADEAVTVNIIIKHGRCVSPDGNVPSELQANCNTDSDCPIDGHVCDSFTRAKAIPSSLTFPVYDWNVPQLVKIEVFNDDAVEGDHMVRVDHVPFSSDTAYGPENLHVDPLIINIKDDDVASVEVSAAVLTLSEAVPSSLFSPSRRGHYLTLLYASRRVARFLWFLKSSRLQRPIGMIFRILRSLP